MPIVVLRKIHLSFESEIRYATTTLCDVTGVLKFSIFHEIKFILRNVLSVLRRFLRAREAVVAAKKP